MTFILTGLLRRSTAPLSLLSKLHVFHAQAEGLEPAPPPHTTSLEGPRATVVSPATRTGRWFSFVGVFRPGETEKSKALRVFHAIEANRSAICIRKSRTNSRFVHLHAAIPS